MFQLVFFAFFRYKNPVDIPLGNAKQKIKSLKARVCNYDKPVYITWYTSIEYYSKDLPCWFQISVVLFNQRLTYPIPNYLYQYHKNCMRDSKENYLKDLESERVKWYLTSSCLCVIIVVILNFQGVLSYKSVISFCQAPSQNLSFRPFQSTWLRICEITSMFFWH